MPSTSKRSHLFSIPFEGTPSSNLKHHDEWAKLPSQPCCFVLLVTKNPLSWVARSGFIQRVSAESPLVSRRVTRGFSPKLWSHQHFQEAEKPPQGFNRFLFQTWGRASSSEALLLPDGSTEEHLSPKLFLLPTDWKDSGKRKICTTIKNRGERRWAGAGRNFHRLEKYS